MIGIASIGPRAMTQIALLTILGLSAKAIAQDSAARPLAWQLAPARNAGKLVVTSSAFRNNQSIPKRFTQFGANESPPLKWSRGPDGTVSYVVIMEDPDVKVAKAVPLWVLYNVPGDSTSLPANLPSTPELQSPAGAMNGLNDHKMPGYLGCHTHKGDTHYYNYEVLALDTKLSLPPDQANRDALVAAMKDHVLADGQLIGWCSYRSLSK